MPVFLRHHRLVFAAGVLALGGFFGVPVLANALSVMVATPFRISTPINGTVVTLPEAKVTVPITVVSPGDQYAGVTVTAEIRSASGDVRTLPMSVSSTGAAGTTFSAQWTATTVGSYLITARATQSGYNDRVSAPVRVNIISPSGNASGRISGAFTQSAAKQAGKFDVIPGTDAGAIPGDYRRPRIGPVLPPIFEFSISEPLEQKVMMDVSLYGAEARKAAAENSRFLLDWSANTIARELSAGAQERIPIYRNGAAIVLSVGQVNQNAYIDLYSAPYYDGVADDIEDPIKSVPGFQKLKACPNAVSCIFSLGTAKNGRHIVVARVSANGISRFSYRLVEVRGQNAAPIVAMSLLSDQKPFLLPQKLNIRVDVADADSDRNAAGSPIERVIIFAGDKKIAELEKPTQNINTRTEKFNSLFKDLDFSTYATLQTYAAEWKVESGRHDLRAVAIDTEGMPSDPFVIKDFIATERPKVSDLIVVGKERPSDSGPWIVQEGEEFTLQAKATDDGRIVSMAFTSEQKAAGGGSASPVSGEDNLYRLTVKDRAAGAEYVYAGIAQDNEGVTNDPLPRMTVKMNKKPDIRDLSRDAEEYQPNTKVTLAALAKDIDSALSSVELVDAKTGARIDFKENIGASKNTDYAYRFEWVPPWNEDAKNVDQSAMHSLKLIVRDADGGVREATFPTVTVRNRAPSVTKFSATKAVYQDTEPVVVSLEAIDNDSGMNGVTFVLKNTAGTLSKNFILNAPTRPVSGIDVRRGGVYEAEIKNLAPDSYIITAIASDIASPAKASPEQVVSVRVNAPPTAEGLTVSTPLVQPNVPATFSIIARDSDSDVKSDSRIGSVMLLRDGVEIAVMRLRAGSGDTYEASWTPTLWSPDIPDQAQQYISKGFSVRIEDTDRRRIEKKTDITVTVKNDPPALVPDGKQLTERSVYQKGETVTLSAAVSDADSGVARLQFFANGTAIHTIDNPSQKVSFQWKPTPGSYALTATATDRAKPVKTAQYPSGTNTVAIKVNNPPTIDRIEVAPSARKTAEYQPNEPVSVTVYATDADGSISQSEVRLIDEKGANLPIALKKATQAATKDGKGNTYAFQIEWRPTWAEDGANTNQSMVFPFRASVKDSDGAQPEVLEQSRVIVKNSAPTISAAVAKSAASDGRYYEGVDIALSATVKDAEGEVGGVTFYREEDKTAIGTGARGTADTFSYLWKNAAAGTHQLSVKAIDKAQPPKTARYPAAAGQFIPIKVLAKPSIVSFTGPTPTVVHLSGGNTGTASIPLELKVSDPDGIVAKAEIIGKGAMASVGSGTYRLTVSETEQKIHSYRARLTDAIGRTYDSTVVAVRVNKLPTAAIVSPAEAAVYYPGTSVTVTIDAADPDGSADGASAGPAESARLRVTHGGATQEYPAQAAGVNRYTATFKVETEGSYSLTAISRDRDDKDSPLSASRTIVAQNATPAVSDLKSVKSVYQTGENVTVSLDALDADSGMARVEFLLNGKQTGGGAISERKVSVTAASAGNGCADKNKKCTYTANFSGIPAGEYSVRAVAFDKETPEKFAATGTAVSMKVHRTPIISAFSAGKPLYQKGERVTVSATVQADNGIAGSGSASFVEFTANGARKAVRYPSSGNCSAASCTFSSVDLGVLSDGATYTLSIRAVDTAGKASATGQSGQAATASVKVNTPPAVSVAAAAQGRDAANQEIRSDIPVTITIAPRDSDGQIASVTLTQEYTPSGSSAATRTVETATPGSRPSGWGYDAQSGNFTRTITPAAGSYSLTAVTHDTDGAPSAVSNTIAFIGRNEKPSIASMNASKGVYQQGESIGVEVKAKDVDSGMKEVAFVLGGDTRAVPATQAAGGGCGTRDKECVYATSFSSRSPGTYTITATARDTVNPPGEAGRTASFRVNAAPSGRISAPQTVQMNAGFTLILDATDSDSKSSGPASASNGIKSVSFSGPGVDNARIAVSNVTAGGARYSLAVSGQEAGGPKSYSATITDWDDNSFTTPVAVVGVQRPPILTNMKTDKRIYQRGDDVVVSISAQADNGMDTLEFSTDSGAIVAAAVSSACVSRECSYSATFTGLADGRSYTITATAKDRAGKIASTTAQITINRPPILTIPTSYYAFQQGDDANVSVTVQADNGMDFVEFKAAGATVRTNAPSNDSCVRSSCEFRGTFKGLSAGQTHRVSITAQDKEKKTAAGTLDIRVIAPPQITNFKPGKSVYQVNESVSASLEVQAENGMANAGDSPAIKNSSYVDFQVDGASRRDYPSRGDCRSAPCSVSTAFGALPAGKTYTLSATARDKAGKEAGATTSVKVNAPPSGGFVRTPEVVAIGNALTLTLEVEDGDSADVSATLSGPYNPRQVSVSGSGRKKTYVFTTDGLPLNTATPTTYSYSATITDNEGGSAAISHAVRVNRVPTLSLSSSPTGPRLRQGTSVTLTMTPSDPDGTISSVDLSINGATETITRAGDGSYKKTFTPNPGGYSVSASVKDTDGARATSEISFNVNAAPSAKIVNTSRNVWNGQSFTARPTEPAVNPGEWISVDVEATDSDRGIREITAIFQGVTQTLYTTGYSDCVAGAACARRFDFHAPSGGWRPGTHELIIETYDREPPDARMSARVSKSIRVNAPPVVSWYTVNMPGRGYVWWSWWGGGAPPAQSMKLGEGTAYLYMTAYDDGELDNNTAFFVINGSTIKATHYSTSGQTRYYYATYTPSRSGQYTITGQVGDTQGGLTVLGRDKAFVLTVINDPPVVSNFTRKLVSNYPYCVLNLSMEAADAAPGVSWMGFLSLYNYWSWRWPAWRWGGGKYEANVTFTEPGTHLISARAADHEGGYTATSDAYVYIGDRGWIWDWWSGWRRGTYCAYY